MIEEARDHQAMQYSDDESSLMSEDSEVSEDKSIFSTISSVFFGDDDMSSAASSFGGASAASSAHDASSGRYNVKIEKMPPRSVKKNQPIPVKKYRSL